MLVDELHPPALRLVPITQRFVEHQARLRLGLK